MAVLEDVRFIPPNVDATVIYTKMKSPIGELTLVGDGEVLTNLSMEEHDDTAPKIGDNWKHDRRAFKDARKQLTEYFSGKRTDFTMPLAPSGTEFRMRVWEALCRIPYGETATYGEIATEIGNPAASRAVGMANHYNPIAIIIPCHRVIGSDGSLTGYGGGLGRKSLLLDLEMPQQRLS